MKFSIAALLCFVLFECSGITHYKAEDRLYSWAKSGLNLRVAPRFDSAVLLKIPFGQEVICKGYKYIDQYWNDSETVIDKSELTRGGAVGIKLKGTWVKISVGDLEGFVFDAYLSRFKPIKVAPKLGNIIEYFELVCDSLIYLEKKNPEFEAGVDRIVFCNGGFYRHDYYSGGSSFQLILPECSMEEAYLLIRYIDNYAFGISQQKDEIIIDQEMGSYKIEVCNNVTIIYGGWSC